jgi:hypothetical protein
LGLFIQEVVECVGDDSVVVNVVLEGEPGFEDEETVQRFVVNDFDAFAECLSAFVGLFDGHTLSAAEVIDRVLALQQQIALFC